jgi:hypothetical protein
LAFSHEEEAMKKRSNARQHAQDKSVIDHLTLGPLKPDVAPMSDSDHHFTERDGHKLAKAVREEWTPSNGGLPRF